MSTIQPAGYLALPSVDTGRAVLLLHAWWGLNDTIKAYCTRLAAAGYLVFAPDMYHGKLADSIDAAEALSTALDSAQTGAEVAQACGFLHERAGRPAHGLAVIGFSLGAFYALELAVSDPERVRSVVLYYGSRPGEYSRARAQFLGHFAESDEFEPQSEVRNLEEALQNAGCPVSFHHYPGTGHWFAEADRAEAFNRAAADLAWERTLAFLQDAPARAGA